MANRKNTRKNMRKSRKNMRKSRKSCRKASRKNMRRSRKMNGGGVFRYVASPVRRLAEGTSNVFDRLVKTTGRVAHDVVYGTSGALGKAANTLNRTGRTLLRNPLKARRTTRRR
jgi:hypothetical protein